MRYAGAINVVEAAYQLDLDETAWMRALGLAAASAIGSDFPVMVTIADTPPGDFRVLKREFVPEDAELERLILGTESMMPPDSRAQAYRQHGCVTIAQFAASLPGLGVDVLRAIFAPEMHPRGIHDAFIVVASDGSGRALSVQGALREETPNIHPKVRNAWSRIASHMIAATRLRQAVGEEHDILGSAEAVMAPDGHLLHASGRAKSRSARQRLREAALAVDRARTREGRSNADEALDSWRGLFAGRWTLAETFDSDGRRFVVAHVNEPETAEDRRLTRRERQVAALAGVGQSDDIIAYTLGLAPATVRTHLVRAMRKMNVTSRIQLIEVASMLVGPGRSWGRAGKK